jgi:hypothetical protein
MRLRVVASRDHQLCTGQFGVDDLKGFDHQLKPLVGSPLAECENAMFGIAATAKVRKLGPAGQDSVRAQVNVIAPIFFMQDPAISRHEDGYRIGEQQHSRRHGAS